MIGRPLVALLMLAATSAAHGQTWRSVDVSRQLRDSSDHRIRVRYAAGKFTMRPTSDPVLFSMQLRYDEDRTEPLHRYDPDTRRLTLGLETQSVRLARHTNDGDFGEMWLALSNAVPLDLELELGATQSRIDAGGLMLNNLRVQTGASDATLDFSVPNRARMRRLDVQLGA